MNKQDFFFLPSSHRSSKLKHLLSLHIALHLQIRARGQQKHNRSWSINFTTKRKKKVGQYFCSFLFFIFAIILTTFSFQRQYQDYKVGFHQPD